MKNDRQMMRQALRERRFVLGGVFLCSWGILAWGAGGARECLYLVSWMLLLSGAGCLFWRFLLSLTGARWATPLEHHLRLVPQSALAVGGLGMTVLLASCFKDLYPALVEGRGILSESLLWMLWLGGLFIAILLAWLPDRLMKKRGEKTSHEYSEQGRKFFRTVSGVGLPLLMLVWVAWSAGLIMSREAHWYSALWPIEMIVLAANLGLCSLPFVSRESEKREDILYADRVNANTGKCLLAFVMLHGYLLYSECMLVWFAKIPEETAYFTQRSGVQWLLWGSVLLGIILPLGMLLFRELKKNARLVFCVKLAVFLGVLMELVWRFSPQLISAFTRFGRDSNSWGFAVIATFLTGIGMLALFLPLSRQRKILSANEPKTVKTRNRL